MGETSVDNENTSSEKMEKKEESSFGDAWLSVDDIANDGAEESARRATVVMPIENVKVNDGSDEDSDTIEYDASPLDVLRAGLEQNKSTVADMKLDELLSEVDEDTENSTIEKEGGPKPGSKSGPKSDLFIRKTVALSKEERLEMLGFCDEDSPDEQNGSTIIVTDADLDAVHERAQQLEGDFARQGKDAKASKRLRGVISSDLRSKFVPDVDEAVPTVFHAMGDRRQEREVKSDTMFGNQYFSGDQTIKHAPKGKPKRAFSAGGMAGNAEDRVEMCLKLITVLSPLFVTILVLLWYLLKD